MPYNLVDAVQKIGLVGVLALGFMVITWYFVKNVVKEMKAISVILHNHSTDDLKAFAELHEQSVIHTELLRMIMRAVEK